MTKKQLDRLCQELERRFDKLDDSKFVDACEEVSTWFEASAFAKRDEMSKASRPNPEAAERRRDSKSDSPRTTFPRYRRGRTNR